MSKFKNSKSTYKEIVVAVKHHLVFCQEMGDSHEDVLQAILDVYKENDIWIEGGHDLQT